MGYNQTTRNRKKSNNKMRIKEFFIVCIFLCITSQLLASETAENKEKKVATRSWNYLPLYMQRGGRWGGQGRWGRRDVESQEIESTNDAGQEVTKDQAKRWYGVGMGYHPYSYSPYCYGYWGKRDVEAQQETKKTRRKRDVEGQEIETTEEDRNAGQEVTKDQAKRWYGYGYGGYGLGYGGFYRPYGYGYWGKRDVETQATRSKRDVEGQEVTKDQAKRWYGVGMGYHPYAYSPYGYGYWGKRDVEAQQETKKTRRKRDVEGQEIETTEEDGEGETSKAKKSSQPMMQVKKSQKIKQRDGTELAWVIIRTLTAHTAMAIGVNVTL